MDSGAGSGNGRRSRLVNLWRRVPDPDPDEVVLAVAQPVAQLARDVQVHVKAVEVTGAKRDVVERC